MSANAQDMWDEDFDEADIEATILKASQVCPMLLPVSQPTPATRPDVLTKTVSTSGVAKSKTLSLAGGKSISYHGPTTTPRNNGVSSSNIKVPSSSNLLGTVKKTTPPANEILEESDQKELEAIMDDPNLWDDSTFLDDPNMYDSESPSGSASNSQSQGDRKHSQGDQTPNATDDANYDKFFDSFDNIDPDLLSSQVIPGTQPRQRWQKQAQSNAAKVLKKSMPCKYPSVTPVAQTKTSAPLHSSAFLKNNETRNGQNKSKFARTNSSDKVVPNIVNNSQLSPSKLSFSQMSVVGSIQGKSSNTNGTMRPPQRPASVSVSTFNHGKTDSNHMPNSTLKRFSDNPALSQTVSSQLHIPGIKQGIKKTAGTENSNDIVDDSNQIISNLQTEVLTKRGEVSPSSASFTFMHTIIYSG